MMHFKNHTRPVLGETPLKNLSPMRIQDFYNDKLDSLAPSTVRYHLHAPLRKCLDRAVQLGYLKMNPCDKVEVPNPKSRKDTINYWSKEQVPRFLRKAESGADPSYYLLYYTAIFTGMRQGELLALRWQGVNFDRFRISITQQISRDANGKMHFYKPKTDSSQRQVAIDEHLRSLLLGHQDYLDRRKKRLGSDWEDNEYVFPSGTGTVLNPRNVLRTIKRLTKKVNKDAKKDDKKPIPVISFHDLRHTHATLMLESGVHPKVVQERLGHSSISTTLDTYSHAVSTLQSDAVDQFASTFYQKQKPRMKVVK